MKNQTLTDLISHGYPADKDIIAKIQDIFSSVKNGNGKKKILTDLFNDKFENEKIKLKEVEQLICSLTEIAKRLLGCKIFFNDGSKKYYIIQMIELYADCLLDCYGDYIHYFDSKSKNPKFRMKCFRGPFLYFYGGRVDIKIWEENIPVSFLIRKLVKVNKDEYIKKDSIGKDNGVLYEVYKKLLGIDDKKTNNGNYKYVEDILKNNNTNESLIIVYDNDNIKKDFPKNKYLLFDTHDKFFDDKFYCPKERVFGKEKNIPEFLFNENYDNNKLKWNFSLNDDFIKNHLLK